uniref:DUF4371 domain-containing protein n=1 Tax=Oryzias latipes TaxID=8090 RepID=A0A3P9LTJ1_ORYLA
RQPQVMKLIESVSSKGVTLKSMQRKINQIFKRKFQSEDEDVQTNTSEGEDEKVKSRNANCIEEPTETPGPSSSGDPFVLPEYPSIRTKEQYEQFKEKNEWIFAKNGMLGCQKCHTVKDLGVASSRGVNIAPNWVAGKICPSGHTRDVQLSSLRKKIHEHKNSAAHKEVVKILETAKKDTLVNMNTKSQDFAFETTARVFRTAYYVAKYNKPFTDFESLIDLQETNSINMGRVLHSKTVCVDIVDHVASQMKKEIMTKIIQNRSKITVLADKSTNDSNKSTLIVFVKASVDGAMEPIAFPLDLVDLDSLCAAHIKEKLINCLLKNGFTMQLLQELLIGFCSDGASVMLGVKSGVGKLLKDDFPFIVLWHCLNHRRELAVDQALDKTGGTKDFQAFLDSLYSLYSQSPKNMRELSECAHNLHITLKRIGRVFSVRWVASSWRAVNAVWQSYSALAQHFQKASEDNSRDSRERAKFSGLRLSSQFRHHALNIFIHLLPFVPFRVTGLPEPIPPTYRQRQGTAWTGRQSVSKHLVNVKYDILDFTKYNLTNISIFMNTTVFMNPLCPDNENLDAL